MKTHNLDLLSDGHVHTKLCLHATGEMEEYIQVAISKGLREIIFLEHMEEGIDAPYRSWLTENDFDLYFNEIEYLKERFKDKIDVKAGVELGYNPNCHDKLLQRLKSRKWDKIGLSCHFFSVAGDQHINLLSRMQDNHARARSIGIDKILTQYFSNLIKAVKTVPADTLCHLDAALRHIPEANIPEKHMNSALEVLTAAKKKGMKIELNTSGFKYRNDPFPSSEILRAAQELNLTYVLGSDAHNPKDVGRYFKEAQQLLSTL